MRPGETVRARRAGGGAVGRGHRSAACMPAELTAPVRKADNRRQVCRPRRRDPQLSAEFTRYVRGAEAPRLPLQASIDLTYRCNNACRHCWLWEADTAAERGRELSTEEWRAVVDQARALGTREWAISGGEPLLRADFAEIFEYMTGKATDVLAEHQRHADHARRSRSCCRRKGNKMVAVYGATADVYDRVTRNPGGFEALLQGLAYLKEAGAGFTVQLIPMRDNWDQWEEMVAFAQSWSKHWRVGAPWLFKSACGDARRNAEIERQRLDPADVVELDQPDVAYEEREAGEAAARRPRLARGAAPAAPGDDRLYAACIEARRDFHVDPYGGMSFCCFVKDPALRYDLRRGDAAGIAAGAVQAAWDEFIPSLADVVRGGREYLEGCAACELRDDCRWCDVYGYLEHGRHGAKVEYLCAVARENREFKESWVRDHRRYYEIAGMTVQVESDLPITDTTFDEKFASFACDGPGADTVVDPPPLRPARPGRRGAWGRGVPQPALGDLRAAGARGSTRASRRDADDPTLHRVAVFSADHTRGELYNAEGSERVWRDGGLGSLTMFPSDQILLARLLADREGCFLHSGGLLIDGQGFLFVGHSDAGKSTTMELVRRELGERAEILCDDRNIVRRWPDGFRVHGTWSHGDVPDVSSASAPLRAILFLEQSARQRDRAAHRPQADLAAPAGHAHQADGDRRLVAEGDGRAGADRGRGALLHDALRQERGDRARAGEAGAELTR